MSDPEKLFDLIKVLRIARDTHGLDAYLQTTGSGVASIWVRPVVDQTPLAMAGPGSTREDGTTARAVDLTVVQDDELPASEGTAADMGLKTEAEVAAWLARFVREHPRHPACASQLDG
jgi:hypothetical protein